MTFKEYPYVRIDIEQIKKDLTAFRIHLEEAPTFEAAKQVIKDYNQYFDHIDSMIQLALVRHSINTKDAFYDEEQAFVNDSLPLIESESVLFTNALLESKYRNELEQELGDLLFKKAELSKKTFKDEIISLLQEENKLTTEYAKLKSSAQIEFRGEVYNLSRMTPFATDKDRETRREATLKVSSWYQQNEAAFDDIYDKLVKVRHEIAIKLGYENFIQLGYDRLKRVDYNHQDVAKYREQVKDVIIPVAKDLEARKAKRLGISDMKSFDLGLSFLSGNPKPKGDSKWQVEKAIQMYDSLSPETSKFFRFMVERELLDLESKDNKEGGGYCTFIPQYESPFIFANFNGTSGDVDVLTHEAGHAFQVYMSKDLLPDYRWPSYEAAEIHSMSMEFLAWPYIDLFFEEDTDKYKFQHLSGGIEFLPYGVLVDHFQHEVYANPQMTKEMRKETWKRLEKVYQPWKVYDENDSMNKGLWWFKQGHIFQDPFYYIDYTLAQVLAFEFWGENQLDAKKTWQKYLNLCKLGGKYSFVKLIEEAGISNPFKDGTIERILTPIKAYLNGVDDTKF